MQNIERYFDLALDTIIACRSTIGRPTRVCSRTKKGAPNELLTRPVDDGGKHVLLFFLLCVATNYSLKEYNECSNKLIFSLVLIVCVFFLVFFFFCFRLLRMLLFLNAHSVCTTKTQFEQKKFLQQHKIRADSYSKAAATMKKQRKKKNNAQNADKEIKVSMNNLSGCAKCECTPQKNGDDGTMGDCAKLCLSSACAVHQRSLHSPA